MPLISPAPKHIYTYGMILRRDKVSERERVTGANFELHVNEFAFHWDCCDFLSAVA